MKKLTIIIAILAATVAANAQQSTTTPKTDASPHSETNTNKATVTIYVSFHCQACVNRLDKNLPYVKGIVDYRVDLAKKSVKLTYNTDKTNLDAIKKEIEKMNFTVADSYEELMKQSNSNHCK
jgi:copper chaperone CopZ